MTKVSGKESSLLFSAKEGNGFASISQPSAYY
jgi:hypothetical protein